jgi:hypothetical protein
MQWCGDGQSLYTGSRDMTVALHRAEEHGVNPVLELKTNAMGWNIHGHLAVVNDCKDCNCPHDAPIKIIGTEASNSFIELAPKLSLAAGADACDHNMSVCDALGRKDLARIWQFGALMCRASSMQQSVEQ